MNHFPLILILAAFMGILLAMADPVVVNPSYTLSWKPATNENVFYEVQDIPDLHTFRVFTYTDKTNCQTDPTLASDCFRVRTVRSNGFHSTEESEWSP